MVVGKALSRKHGSTGSAAYVKVKCDCGVEKEVRSSSLRNRRSKSCGCNQGNRKLKPGQSTINALRSQYIGGAKLRKLKWGLSKAQFKALVLSPCVYCGAGFRIPGVGKNRAPIEVTGIDRRNSLEGYTPENCVSCCTMCNRMKWDLSEEEFFKAIKQIGEYLCLR